MSDDRGRSPAETEMEMTHVVMPNDTNPLGSVFGGRVMEWVDIAGGIVAMRHCRETVVTVSVDEMSFLYPIKMGHIAVLKARVNYVGRSSLEVGVKVLSEDPYTGERRHTSTAYVTYVALDAQGNRLQVPRLILETEEDERRFREGEERHRRHVERARRVRTRLAQQGER